MTRSRTTSQRKNLSKIDVITLSKNFPVYFDMRFISMFKTLFGNFHKEKKLHKALAFIKYKPFKDSIQQQDYDFFYQLVEALPKTRHKKLLFLYNDQEIIKLLFLSISNNQPDDAKQHTDIKNTLKIVQKYAAHFMDKKFLITLNDILEEENIDTDLPIKEETPDTQISFAEKLCSYHPIPTEKRVLGETKSPDDSNCDNSHVLEF